MLNQRGNLLIILGVILLIIIVVVLGFYYFNTIKEHSERSPSIASTLQTTPTPNVDDTVNWQTYTDEKLRFTIKYPNEIVILRSFGNSEGGAVFVRANESEEDFRSITTLNIYFRGESGTTPEQALKSECPTREDESCQEKFEAATINNAVGVRTLGPNYPQEDNYYLTSHSGKSKVVRLFLFPKSNNTNEDLQQFKKMIHTFRFLD